MIINVMSDNKLISLRKEKMGYKIPNGKLFNFVSCPNYLGEIIEWFGFFILVPSIASLSFSLDFIQLNTKGIKSSRMVQRKV